jgi:uncharacterized membrane protein YeaQ/YmgE (transglycosylase-associated protein family)
MSIIAWIVIGALAGWLASIVTGRNKSMNWLENIVAGVVGALVGGFLYGLLTDSDFTAGFDIGTVIVATLGAILVVIVYSAIRREA